MRKSRMLADVGLMAGPWTNDTECGRYDTGRARARYTRYYQIAVPKFRLNRAAISSRVY